MVKKYNDDEKHQTGKPPSVSDFVKHPCANKIEVWEKGQKVSKAIRSKKEFNAIRGNEDMVPVNSRAADECPYCHLDITDAAFVPCTEEDVEALSK